MSVTKSITRPLWAKITFCGFAAVLLASLSIGTLALYEQYTTGQNSLQERLANSLSYIKADLDGSAARRRVSLS